VWVILLAACPGRPIEPSPPRGSGAQPPDAGAQVTATGPTDRECDELVSHALTLRLNELRATKPANQLPTDAELAKLAAELRADPGCRTLSRHGYGCAMAAKSLAELEGCYLTPSSSTSNSSVAPGGMTPAAPRSP
jgi:hypothetical protein